MGTTGATSRQIVRNVKKMKGSTSAIDKTKLTRAEKRALYGLRARYRRDHDLFGADELARLRFLRWLCETGRLQEAVSCEP